MNFKTLILLSLILLGGICTGCDRFLDVQPKDQYTEKQLLATPGGYYTAMNGLYNNLTSNSLYGKNLSYELIDVISKRYAPLAKSTYLTSLNSWGYAEENVSKALESTWATAYTTILNCNVILENLATQQGILSPAETNLMKGELLALRAFLHFDMLRLFGPIYKEDPSAPSIPYNESVKIMNLPLLSADSIVHNKIMRDLDEAEKLLAKDPVIPEGPMASALEDENEVYLRYRQLRMNYYAVLALKARVYLYAGEKDKALQAAYKLLKDKTVSEWFPPVDPNKLLANNVDPDRVFSTEVLMGIYMKKRGDIYTYSFDAENAGNNFLQPRNSFVDGNLFAGETQDYRYQSQWAQATSIGVTGHIFTKYKAIQDGDAKLFYSSFMPLIRLSEMYYIAAECEPKVSDGNSWLNQIRTLRGLPEITITDENELMSKLRIEYLREFWGEGQIFFMYKRLFVNILNTENGHNTSTYGASAARYVPPHAGQRNRKPLKQHIMKTKKILYLFLLPLIFTACETKDIPVYTSDDAALYFQRTASYIWGSTTVTYSNSTEFTFAGAAAEKNSVTYSAEVRTMGNVTDYDRPFKVEIDKEMSTGIQGVHFDTNLDTLKIKAGKSNAYVRITFYRTPDLLDSTLTVVLHLIENEHFNARIDEYKKTNQWNSSSENLDGTRYTFKFNEQYSEPTYWSWFGEGFLGPWTPQKYIVVNSVMGWTVNDWSQAGQAGAKVSYGRLGFAAKAVRNYLQEQADNDTPVKDKDGSYMQLADGYTVDYSRYE
ncbi:hypothetical protein Odosp_2959 [Odoribacter splanchnicus DSM 20712]|jgi:hypothetical protein|uniref:RagB/SusD family nutrient uptake outer membrane protein n=1 Tax=Odoribacter splanchnicus (strain ATCC 29572 / DSM 20712 / CIP 104287 / JCM 15291 / NCTC 10825 / 1651/6) TaxID=709991 RepID=F9Z6H0_ODOSD|nr:DUF4843 domain-containing protein [Odoribacter splanchnicus]ADY33927.1 hypothetical protein Odosp_2959 [Odoribacter splanchnicus DSM 20712]UEB88377.1 RagB/SusD family nutrient uptake outer membrane protein [Odoribacter splanchnicus DSM 20712]SNV42759.1 SusD family [Odoribacter splanchnicus]